MTELATKKDISESERTRIGEILQKQEESLLSDPFGLLGLKKSAGAEEIKTRYRQMLNVGNLTSPSGPCSR